MMKNDFNEIGTHPSLKDRVYENLKQQIISGKLEPNRHLLEAELSEMMKISRAPIREALNILEKEGFVTIIPRKGAKVSSISKEEVENIWEIRSVLEPYAARNAAQKCVETELNKIENKLKKTLKRPYDFSDYFSCDLELHELLYKDLDNELLKEIILNVRQNSLRILHFAEGRNTFSEEFAFADTNEHLQIIDVLKARDSDRASATVYLHIQNSKQRILTTLERTE
jgi:DNA-binding GntR family transcriptional regulator